MALGCAEGGVCTIVGKAIEKRIKAAVLVCACLLMTACEGTTLAEREIIRAVFFEKNTEGWKASLLPEKQNEEEQQSMTDGTGKTPLAALTDAERKLDGTAFYGLMDCAVFPSDCGWEDVETLGETLYQKAQPSPEISVWLNVGTVNTAQEASELYESLRETEKKTKIHCGLQQLFEKGTVCCIPQFEETGYSIAVISEQNGVFKMEDSLLSQLAAVLNRQTDRMDALFENGRYQCTADVSIWMEADREGQKYYLQLTNGKYTDLTGQKSAKEVEASLQEHLQQCFSALEEAEAAYGENVFSFGFWQTVEYGAAANTKTRKLITVIEK